MPNVEEDLARLGDLPEEELLIILIRAGEFIGEYKNIGRLGQPYGYVLGVAQKELIPKIFAERKAKAAERNLLYLKYKLYPPFVITELTEEPPEGVTVNTKAETWSFEGNVYSIGTMRRQCDRAAQYGPIGVYDRTNLLHLNNMISVVRIVTKEPATGVDD
jgi:hypothetical protein